MNVDEEKEDRRRIVETLQGTLADSGTNVVDFSHKKKEAPKGRTGAKTAG